MSKTSSTYDAIVIGVGGMGSAALYHLARRGKKVLGLERYDIPHQMGSSHGLTRIIRLAYYEHPSYVPLLRRSYELWRSLEQEAGEQLFHLTGSVDAGPPDSDVVQGALRACQLHQLTHQLLTSAELGARYPGYALPAGHLALFQPEGGFLLSERCIVQHVIQAQARGAEVHAREAVTDWEPLAGGVEVHTDRGRYTAEKLVISAGPWASRFIAPLAGKLQPERQVVAWFQPLQPPHFGLGRFPVFNLKVEEGRYYGFPVFHVPGFKVGCYHHLGEKVDPDAMDRECHARDEALLRGFVERYFPAGAGPLMCMRACIFTNTADEHFVLGLHPDHAQVAIAAGFSGHGFKFCSVVGEIMAGLVIEGRSPRDLSLFDPGRLP
ncbi:MAG: N-methyl-L-tryptophan oxidase [Candidatus Latescibacteria bacterium]|nr:N-methyl-L-tryptophan oxidase [Candidatus Latescibacterota bacterium]